LIKANKIGKQYRILGHELLRLVFPEFDEKATGLYQKVKIKTIEKTKDWSCHQYSAKYVFHK